MFLIIEKFQYEVYDSHENGQKIEVKKMIKIYVSKNQRMFKILLILVDRKLFKRSFVA